MKKLQILVLLALSTIAIQADYGHDPVDESIDAKIARQQARTQEEKDAYLANKAEKFNFRKETPEFRLIIKALEYRADQVEGRITEEHFLNIMENKEKTYKHNLGKNDRIFGDEESAFLEFCKIASLTEIASKIEEMKACNQQFIDQQS
jgi:hypothetical protein